MNIKLKAINTHTSNMLYSGTDAEVLMKLNLGDGETPEWITLDNYGDDMERGNTDIYAGTTLDKGNQMLRDYAEFYPETAEIQITFSLLAKGTLAHAWNTDLVKLYFSGKNGTDVVIRCLTGEQWIEQQKSLFHIWVSQLVKCFRHNFKKPCNSLAIM